MVVTNIKFENNKVKIICDKKEFFLSKENYIENPITIDSEISDSKINYLMEYERVLDSKTEIIKMLNKKILSEYEVFKKLNEKSLKINYVNDIMNSLKRAGLINDEFVATITLEKELLKRKGRKEIIKVLKEKRIALSIIDKVMVNIEEDVYLSNFNKVVEKYTKLYDTKSNKIKFNMLKQKLEEYGYEQEYISMIDIEKDEDKESDLARKYLNKIMKNKNINLSDHQNSNKIKIKLATKGFNYDIINKVIEEAKKDETY